MLNIVFQFSMFYCPFCCFSKVKLHVFPLLFYMFNLYQESVINEFVVYFIVDDLEVNKILIARGYLFSLHFSYLCFLKKPSPNKNDKKLGISTMMSHLPATLMCVS